MNGKLSVVLLLLVATMLGIFLEDAFAQTWFAAGSRPQDYEMGGDPSVEHGTANAGFIRSKVSGIDGFGTWMTRIDPGEYLGQGIRMSAYVKTENVGDWVGLWMRVDGAANQLLSFDNMGSRPITGTTDWNKYEVVLDVPENSTGIFFGILLDGTGEAIVDGLQQEPVARTWIRQNSGISQSVISIQAVDENTVWAGAALSVYLRTTDGGLNWTSGTIVPRIGLNFFSIAAIDQNTAYFLGQNLQGGDGRIYKTSDGGSNWTLQYQNTSPGVFFNSIAFWDQDHGIAVSDPVDGSFVIVTTTNGGAEWNQVPAENIPTPLPGEFAGITGEGGTSLAVEGTKNAWFGTGNASPVRVFKSTDQGLHWMAVNTPLSTAGEFHGIQTIVFQDSLTGFAGGVDYPYNDTASTLVKTNDGGLSWTEVSSFLPIYPSTLVYIPNTNNVSLFVTSGQGAGRTDDGGANWKKLLSTEPVGPLSFANPNVGWAANSSGIVKYAGDQPTTVTDYHQARPESFQLAQNHPNPFNPSTNIQFTLARRIYVKLKVFDILGREVASLVDKTLDQGTHNVVFEANDLASGIYFYRLQAGAFVQTKKLTLLR